MGGRTHIYELKGKKEGDAVSVLAHVYEVRDLGKLVFLILREKDSLVQVVFKKGVSPDEEFEKAKSVRKESFVEVKGKLKKNEKAINGMEIIGEKINVLAVSDAPLPIDVSGKIESTLDKRLDWRFIDMKNPKVMGIFLLQSKLVGYMEEFLRRSGFVRIFTSRITNAATEGGADYFPIMYFDKEAFLAQSPQLYKESVLVSGIDRVYDVGMVYRAEPHNTTRHLCEYISFDVEMVSKGIEDILKLQEDLVKHSLEKLKKDEEIKPILERFQAEINVPKKIPAISFEEALRIAKEMGVKDIEEFDLTPECERKICEYFSRNENVDFVVVRDFPFKKKPFYIMRNEENPSICYAFDLLYRGLELTSGGQREHRYEERVKNIREKGIDPETFDHLRFFKYGMPPHAGFGLGIERFTCLILGLKNVREASLTPRDPDRLIP